MKKQLLFLAALISCTLANAQVLYTEDFNSYTVGNLGTDYSGQTPGQGGWYTESLLPPPQYTYNPSNNEYQIATEPLRGNILQIQPLALIGELGRNVFRTDLDTYWQQRTNGNNILKLSFDKYIDDSDDSWMQLKINLFSNEGRLASFDYAPYPQYMSGNINGARGDFNISQTGLPFMLNGQPLKLPLNTWVTFELYIDYATNNYYFYIPTINYVAKKTATINLQLGGTEQYNDSVTKILVAYRKLVNQPSTNTYTPKIDNINLSALNTIPAQILSINEVLAKSFNLYPNPATNIVNITNNENLNVEQITVYNSTGKQINTQTFNNTQQEIQLNVNNLASGTYMLHLQTAQGTAVKKLIKK